MPHQAAGCGITGPDEIVGGLIETGFAFTSKESPSFDPREVFLSMCENDRIDPLAAAHATPVDRSDLENSFFQHKSTAAMALTGLSDLGGNNLSHEQIPPSG
jgi:hypothetical protein